MAKSQVYLNFNGNTEEAFNFYRSVFGGEFSILKRFKDIPEGNKISENYAEKIMHIRLPISDGYDLMATDALESMGQKLNVGNNFYISINTDSREEADRIYNALSVDGKVEMPLADTFWGDYFGMFKDKFDIQWMITFEKNLTI